MEELNYRFFDLFSKVDKLCIDVYQNEHGLAGYIEDMRSTPADVEQVPEWEADLLHLINLRNIRNSLANTPGAFQEEICTQEHVDWIERFYERVLQRQDPMALLSSLGYQTQEDSRNKRTDNPQMEVPEGTSAARERYVNGYSIAALLVVLILLTCALAVFILLPDT